MAFVYWIKHKDHKDMFSEGYVGVTKKCVSERFTQHLKLSEADRPKLIVHKALKKYSNFVEVITLLEGEEDYCYEVEGKLRPTRVIGWNTAIGGGKSPISGIPKEEHPCYGKPCSSETRAKISKANSGNKNGMSKMIGELNPFFGKHHSDETKQKLRDRHVSQAQRDKARLQMLNKKAWETTRADKSFWVQADLVHKAFLEEQNITKLWRKLGLDTKNKLLAILTKFKNGWVPTEDADWLEFKQNYKGHLCPMNYLG